MNFYIIFISSLLLICLFKIQKIYKPSYYFAFSEVIGDINTNKMIMGRIAVIVIHNIIIYAILNYLYPDINISEIILLSNFLGCLLIVWPLLYAPEHNLLLMPSFKTKMLLYIYYISFIVGAMFLSYLTYYFGEVIFGNKSLKEVWENNGVLLVISFFFNLVYGKESKYISTGLTNSFHNDRENQNELYK